jgi:excisionase family DNA binding protein
MPRLPTRSKKHSNPQETSSSAPFALGHGSLGPTVDAHDVTSEQNSPAPPFLSLREAADWLCISISTLKRLIAKGELSIIKVGARRKIPASVLAAYVGRDILLPSQVLDILQSEQD